jgi:probable rRNA maturation factor
MPVYVSRRAPQSSSLDKVKVRRFAEKMLAWLDLEEAELSILLCDDARIRELNFEHRKKNKATDVLSFPQLEFSEAERPLDDSPIGLLGDVVISIDTAERQAQSRKRPLIEEVRFLLAHGLLHLLGHDHMEPAEKLRMSSRARQLVKAASP